MYCMYNANSMYVVLCMNEAMFVCMYQFLFFLVCMYVCMYDCMYIHIYTYIHTVNRKKICMYSMYDA